MWQAVGGSSCLHEARTADSKCLHRTRSRLSWKFHQWFVSWLPMGFLEKKFITELSLWYSRESDGDTVSSKKSRECYEDCLACWCGYSCWSMSEGVGIRSRAENVIWLHVPQRPWCAWISEGVSTVVAEVFGLHTQTGAAGMLSYSSGSVYWEGTPFWNRIFTGDES
jgi:hypothetical protein